MAMVSLNRVLLFAVVISDASQPDPLTREMKATESDPFAKAFRYKPP